MTRGNKLSNTAKFIIAILICEATGIISGLIAGSSDNNEWFSNINKPAWNPPASIFAPVWTLLYLLMGIALGLVWKSNAGEKQKQPAMRLFAVQLFLNFWWSIIFFRFHAAGPAFAEIVILWLTILLTIFSVARISKAAAWLLVPYISWVSFASLLSYSIWMLN
jgi:benzodiazapine receptor